MELYQDSEYGLDWDLVKPFILLKDKIHFFARQDSASSGQSLSFDHPLFELWNAFLHTSILYCLCDWLIGLVGV